MRALFVFIAFSQLIFSSSALAHTRSQSFSSWTINEQTATFVFAVDSRRVTQLSQIYSDTRDLNSLLLVHLEETVRVSQDGAPCERVTLRSLNESRDTLRISGQFKCARPIKDDPAIVTIAAFQIVSATHIHIARVDYVDAYANTVLREGRASFILEKSHAPHGFLEFISIGFFHVLSGVDHLAFLAALILVAATTRSLILCVTGFTLGHTVSLALSALGIIQPITQLIEAMIGFTIAATAIEAGARYGLNRQRAMTVFAGLSVLIVLAPVGVGAPMISAGVLLGAYAFFMGRAPIESAKALLPIVTIAFGLIHGAGFAGGLLEFSFTQTNIIAPLLGFNVGVEIAQLTAIGVILALLYGARNIPVIANGAIERTAGVVIFALGYFWFAQRVWA